MTTKALETMTAGMTRYTNIQVGDKVIATWHDGSQMVTARVYAIHADSIEFLKGQVRWTVDMELAAQSTLLIERFDRQAVIAEILEMIA